jgi:ABC-type nitrate/sulfonate/bicarbonate transport system substrate-binding protein
MRDQCASWSRRQFVGGLTLAGTAGLLGLCPEEATAEPPPETPRLRLYKFPSTCLAPQYMADELLRAEGFTDVQYLEFPEGVKGLYDRVGSGAVDITQWYLTPFLVAADKKTPIVFLSGVHVGCQELVAIGPIRSIRDLKGKTVVATAGGVLNSFVVAMLGQIPPAATIQCGEPMRQRFPVWCGRGPRSSSCRRRLPDWTTRRRIACGRCSDTLPLTTRFTC